MEVISKRGRVKLMNKKKTSTFSKVTKIVIWLMLIAIIGSTLLVAVTSIL